MLASKLAVMLQAPRLCVVKATQAEQDEDSSGQQDQQRAEAETHWGILAEASKLRLPGLPGSRA